MFNKYIISKTDLNNIKPKFEEVPTIFPDIADSLFSNLVSILSMQFIWNTSQLIIKGEETIDKMDKIIDKIHEETGKG